MRVPNPGRMMVIKQVLLIMSLLPWHDAGHMLRMR